jgi:hypothetical protein
MTTTTFSPNLSPQTEKSAKYHWKIALYVANFLYALFLIRYGRLFSDTFTVPSSIFVITVFLYAGFARLRRMSEGSRVKAYIKGHEGWAHPAAAARRPSRRPRHPATD